MDKLADLVALGNKAGPSYADLGMAEPDVDESFTMSAKEMLERKLAEIRWTTEAVDNSLFQKLAVLEELRAKVRDLEQQRRLINNEAEVAARAEGDRRRPETMKQHIVRSILMDVLDERMRDKYWIAEEARHIKYGARAVKKPALKPCFRFALHCGRIRVIMNVLETMTFENLHDQVALLWKFPADKFRIYASSTRDMLSPWSQFEYNPADRVVERLQQLRGEEDAGFGALGMRNLDECALPPLFVVYIPYQADLTLVTKRPGRIDRIFAQHDTMHLGKLNLIEFRDALISVFNKPVDRTFARLLFRSYSSDRGIDLFTFRGVVTNWDKIQSGARKDMEYTMSIEEAYVYLEKDVTTPLYYDEFVKLVRLMHPRISKADTRQLFTDMDLDNGGSIEMSELEAFWPTVLVEVARLKKRDIEQRDQQKKSSKSKRNPTLTPAIQYLLKEGAGYFLLLVLFVMLIGLRRSVQQMFFLNDGMEQLLTQQRIVLQNASTQTATTFRTLTTQGEFWQFARGPVNSFIELLGNNDAGDDPIASNYLVSAIRFQTHRAAASAKCDLATRSMPNAATVVCLDTDNAGDSTSKLAVKTPYGRDNRHEYDYRQFSSIVGQRDSYDGSGYTKMYRVGNETMSFVEFVDDLETDFIDDYVTAFAMSFTIFNPHVNLYSELNYLVERPSGGVLYPQVIPFTLRLDMYSTALDRIIAMFEGITVLLAVAVLVQEVKTIKSEIKRDRELDRVGALSEKRFLPLTIFGVIDITLCAMLLAAQFTRLYLFAYGPRRNVAVHYGPLYMLDSPMDLRYIHFLYSLPYQIDSSVIAFFGVRMLKYTVLWETLEFIGAYLFRAAMDLVPAVALFFLMGCAWLLVVWVWLGELTGSLYTPLRVSNRLMQTLYGQFSFSDSMKVFFAYVFSMVIVMRNYFVVVVRDAYVVEQVHYDATANLRVMKPQLTVKNVLATFFPFLTEATTAEEAEQARQAEIALARKEAEERAKQGYGIDEREAVVKDLQDEIAQQFTFEEAKVVGDDEEKGYA